MNADQGLTLLRSNVLGVMTGPAGVAADAAGNLFIADFDTGHVLKCSPSGDLTTLATLNKPRGAAVDVLGNVYIAETGNPDIQVWKPSTQSVSLLPNLQPARSGIAVDASGNVFYNDLGSSEVIQWSPATQQ